MTAKGRVNVQLFGSFAICLDGVPKRLPLAGATRALLLYLLCFPDRQVRREFLIEQFWSSLKVERRFAALNSAVWRVRKALVPFTGLDLEATARTVTLHLASDVTCDALLLAQATRCARSTPCPDDAELESLAAALECSGAPLLEGMDDDWVLIERERMATVHLRGLALMMRVLAEHRRYEDALEYGERILAIDPFRESTIQEMMCLLLLAGQRVRALRLYQRSAKLLEDELGITPMPETLELYHYICSEPPEAAAQPPVRPRHQSGRNIGERLSVIERSRLDLYRAISVQPA